MKTLNQKLDTLNSAINDVLGGDTPSWKRQLVCIGAALTAYAGIAAGGVVITNMIVAAVAGTSVFLSLFLSIIAMLATFIVATTAATKVYGWAMSFDYANVERRVSGWFKRSEAAKADAVDESITKRPRTRRANSLATAH